MDEYFKGKVEFSEVVMPKSEIEDILDQLYRGAQMQTGGMLNGRWFHDGAGCPGCGSEVGVVKFKKKKALSINAFIYREHKVLIAYMLCSKCANHIIVESKKNPYGKLPIHDEIEKNLKAAFVKHLGH
jgi:hypothetical protein